MTLSSLRSFGFKCHAPPPPKKVVAGSEKLKDEGGAAFVTVPNASLVNQTTTNPGNTDIAYKVLTKFPTNTTAIRIDNKEYTATNFPTEGVKIPTDILGEPLIPIEVNPDFEGRGDVVLSMKAYDIKDKPSKNIGEVTIKFGAKITGNVWNDGNGDLSKSTNELYIAGDGNLRHYPKKCVSLK